MKTVFLLFLFSTIIARPIFASVVINEFEIEPNQIVEILNTASQSADISHFYIDDNGGTTFFTIPDDSILPPNNCLVFSGEFNLNKSSSDTIRLFDNASPPTSSSARLLDSYSYKASSGSGIVFFRQPDGQNIWATGEASFGLFNTSHLSCLAPPTPTLIPTAIPSSPIPTQLNPDFDEQQIIISEFMPAPGDGREWVELLNLSDSPISLIRWYIDDAENSGGAPYQFSLTMNAHQYGVVDLSRTLFNNSGDIVRLLNTKGEEVDSQLYTSSLPDISWGKDTNQNIFCLQSPSKNANNIPCLETATPATSSGTIKKTGDVLGSKTIPTPTKTEVRKNIGIIDISAPKKIPITIPKLPVSERNREWILYGSVSCPLFTALYVYIHMQRKKRLAK